MKKVIVHILLMLLYCLPFSYYAMYKDFQDASINGYLWMIGMFSLNTCLNGIFGSVWTVVIGNSLSTLLSYYVTMQIAGPERWFGYFKPFQPTTLVVIIGILMLVPQLIAVFFIKRKRRN